MPKKPDQKLYHVLVKHDKGKTKLKVRADSALAAERAAYNMLPRGVNMIYDANAVEVSRLQGKKTRIVYLLNVVYPAQTESKRVNRLIVVTAGKKPYSDENLFAERKFSFIYGTPKEAHIAKKKVLGLKIKDLEAAVKPFRIVGESVRPNFLSLLIKEIVKRELLD